MSDLHVVILAAGMGTRMKSEVPKVLHRVAGRPLLFWPIELAHTLAAERVVAVLGHGLEQVRAALDARYPAGKPGGTVDVVRQERQLGTGDAVRCALGALSSEPDDAHVLILYGDVPLLQKQTVDLLLAAQGVGVLALVTTRPPSPAGYGRVVRQGEGRIRIVEDRDCTATERAIGEVNAGIYAAALGFLRREIGGLSAKNAQGELYLTDLVARAPRVGTVEAAFDDVAGVNDRVDLARADAVARRRIAERWMREGVTIAAPDTVFIDADVASLGRDVEIGPGVALRGARTRLADRVRVDVGCVLTDTEVGVGTSLLPYTVLTDTRVGAGARLGPFAHCRPGSVLEDGVHLGNFVETKKTRLGPGSKANHLAYLGDSQVGAKVNVGAGTITCNYDGVAKHVTVIEDGAFIGSDTQLVAPVRVGKDAYVAAGATITKDVPAGALAITRTPQVNVEGYVERKRRKQAEKKK
jgi:bifunctional UDP-N-acetylglucosamine pyrophosphorylase / glucosamine-1-phosphate N-acetyltransferase